jgi:hypothetical protein
MKENTHIRDIERLEMYIKERYETGQAFDNLINNIKEKQKKRYMNIKVKAALTVVVFFGSLIGTMVGILSIPKEWIKEYGVTIIETIMIIVSLVFAYYIALDYYKSVDEIKRFDQQTKRKVEGQDSRIL